LPRLELLDVLRYVLIDVFPYLSSAYSVEIAGAHLLASHHWRQDSIEVFTPTPPSHRALSLQLCLCQVFLRTHPHDVARQIQREPQVNRKLDGAFRDLVGQQYPSEHLEDSIGRRD